MAVLCLLLFSACPVGDDDDSAGETPADDDTVDDDDAADDDAADDDAADDDAVDDDVSDDDTFGDDDSAAGPDAFADAVVSYTIGDGGGLGEASLPDVVLGPPQGAGDGSGSTDVLSLGMEGEIVLELSDVLITDGPGVDLLVFENAFVGWIETGTVAVSADGVTWYEFPCDPDDADGGYPGCAGVNPVYSNDENGIDPTDPDVAGGDGFDLADLGIESARYVRVRDSGVNLSYGSPGGGFDLDAIAVVNGN